MANLRTSNTALSPTLPFSDRSSSPLLHRDLGAYRPPASDTNDEPGSILTLRDTPRLHRFHRIPRSTDLIRAGILTALAPSTISTLHSNSRECSICACDYGTSVNNADVKRSVQLRCKHVFCEDCIMTWFQPKNGGPVATCPMCRTALFEHRRHEQLEVDVGEPFGVPWHETWRNPNTLADAIRGFSYPAPSTVQAARARVRLLGRAHETALEMAQQMIRARASTPTAP